MYVCMLQNLSWIASDLDVSKGKGLVLSNSPYDQSCPGLGCRKALVAMVTWSAFIAVDYRQIRCRKFTSV
jgi:hypothetical protein